MTDDAPTPITVAPSDTPQQVKAQGRLILAALAGGLLGRMVHAHILPAGLDSEPVVDAVAGVTLYMIPAVWSAARVRLQHVRLWSLAINPRVPDDLVRPACSPVEQLPVPNAPDPGEQPMSFLHLHLLTDSRVAALKADGHAISAAVGSKLMTAVALAAQAGNPIGAAALTAVETAEASGKPGPEKKVDAIAAVAPVVVAEAEKGGKTLLAKDAETFAGLVVEEVLPTMKQTSAVVIGEAVLHALGFGAPAPAPAQAA